MFTKCSSGRSKRLIPPSSPVVIYNLLSETEETSRFPTAKYTCASSSFEPVYPTLELTYLAPPSHSVYQLECPATLQPIRGFDGANRKKSGAWGYARVGLAKKKGVLVFALAVEVQLEQQQPLIVSPVCHGAAEPVGGALLTGRSEAGRTTHR